MSDSQFQSMDSNPQLLTLSDDWRQWIAKNLMLGSASQDLIRILVDKGHALDLAAQEVKMAQNHPYVAGGQSLALKLKKRDWVLQCQTVLQEQSPSFGEVERRERLSRDEFYESYYYRNRPVVITGMLNDWPALTRWTPDYLKASYGHLEVEVQCGRSQDPEYEINSDQYKKRMPFSEYIDWVNSGLETNNFYMTANNSGHNASVLKGLWQDVPLLSEYLKADEANQGFFWYGPQGTVTPLHHDLTNNFMAQVQGHKMVRMIPPSRLPEVYNHLHCYSQVDLSNPDYERFPQFAGVRTMDVMLAPGEILFLPVGYWHHVVGVEISITMTYTNFLPFNDFGAIYSTYGFFD
ncbi:cupin-like domain-containing protein [Vampirovibrio sp.]|uniref:cupin-like domain-containing protein n=1 Tax=Vampirovibrio sp. TaxID=2717857 RepID=UPI0035934D9F